MSEWNGHVCMWQILDEPTNPIVITAAEVPEIEEVSTGPISKGEVKNGISSLKNGKAAGVDNIVAELLEADIKTTTQKLHKIIQMIWQNEVMPHEWLKGLIVKLPKEGNLKEYTNWRGITLLVIASNVLGKILIERLKRGADKRLRAEQAGCRQGRSTTEQIFILRNIIGQSYEWQSPLVLNFIDFEKAFNSLHRPSLWEIIKAYGIPVKIIRIVQLLYQDSECAVLDNGQASEWFKVNTGVKQGCVMSGFLFLLAIDWIMCETTKQANTGIRWRFMDQLERSWLRRWHCSDLHHPTSDAKEDGQARRNFPASRFKHQ